jgi:soluble lytic murein transglycosylase-like protein
MPEIKTSRPYKERLLDGFDRSRLREEVRRAKGSRLSGLKKRYASMVLGASLAVGGLGIPLKSMTPNRGDVASQQGEKGEVMQELTKDLAAATEIAREVTGGVNAAAETIVSPMTATVSTAAAEKVAEAAQEAVKEEFFKKEIPFGQLIYKEAVKNDLDPALVAAVVKTESRFIPTARSGAGAQGLMQLVPRTGRWMGAKNLMNPTQNVQAGTKYLKYLNERFDGDETKVIAAYNAGEGNVKRFGGVPPFKETRSYVKKVRAARAEYKEQVSGQIAELAESAAPDTTLMR